MPVALIHDSSFADNSHGDTVRDYFLTDAPADWTVEAYEAPYSDVEGAVDRAIDVGATLLIRSAVGVWTYRDEWRRAHEAGVQVVHAHGSNSPTTLPNPPRLFEAVVVGGEDPSDGLEDDRSSGPGLEVDAITHDGLTQQSWATPTVAALLAAYYNERVAAESDHPMDDARALLRDLALRNNDEGAWSPERGYGTVVSRTGQDVEFPGAAHGETGVAQWASRPTAPQPQPPVNIQADVVEDDVLGNVAVDASWTPIRAAGVTETVVEVDGQEVLACTDESARVYSQGQDGLVTIAFRGRSASAISSPQAHAERDGLLVALPAPFLPPRREDNATQDVTIVHPPDALTALEQRDGLSGEWAQVSPIGSAASGERAFTVGDMDPTTNYEFRYGVYDEDGDQIGYSAAAISSPTLTDTPYVRAYL